MRINKFLAEAGVCSRRRADELVAAGQVRVNGEVAGMGAQVEAGDSVEVQGKPVVLAEVAPCHILLHKPVGVVSTASDPEGRRTVLDILPERFRVANGRPRRLYPAGRLDFFSEGLLLITDDGPLTHALTHPARHVPRVYVVAVREPVTEAMLQTMRSGMTLAEGEKLAPVGLRVRVERDKTVMEMTLHQGVNRQIRRMCRDLGLTVLKLTRVAMGPLSLGTLPSGEARLLTAEELSALRRSVGLETPAPAQSRQVAAPRPAQSRPISPAPQNNRDRGDVSRKTPSRSYNSPRAHKGK